MVAIAPRPRKPWLVLMALMEGVVPALAVVIVVITLMVGIARRLGDNLFMYSNGRPRPRLGRPDRGDTLKGGIDPRRLEWLSTL